ncbi:protease I [Thermosporothrix hazakensis]|jgi:protease I|uniref:Protease I n=2 Tax=Thermosporothrix TaxID=768650 RepID=A0A326U1B3_THEHA|nr:type 1 glutamine amidotransferase domain-containing protein [Thermosporothrix hazakensis]PZW23938.1 protease I [Thermosporothrix hazakensis]BBH90426.1 glutamine amidotransferase [Thermosporothrix sp. COM3]GCE48463.1 glutamine amidotransferase [Thermosporothrix hazakensis]
MTHHKIDGMRVAVLVADDFEQAEFTEPIKALKQAGASVVVVSPQAGQVTGMNHDEKADRFPVDLLLDNANPDDFDAVMLPGGALNADSLRVNPKAQEFVRKIDQSGRPIAAICHAPWLLVSAGCVKGRTLTSYYTIQDDIRNAGGNWVDKEMVRDKNWVTSRSPKDLPAFNSAMVTLFCESREQATQKTQNVISM